MAVDGSMLNKYVGKKFFLENKKITISKIAAIKEEV